jgi:hypothetical protein
VVELVLQPPRPHPALGRIDDGVGAPSLHPGP